MVPFNASLIGWKTAVNLCRFLECSSTAPDGRMRARMRNPSSFGSQDHSGRSNGSLRGVASVGASTGEAELLPGLLSPKRFRT